jgi:hypothetical protein
MGDSCAQGGKPGIKETGTPEDVPRTAAITHAAGIKKAPADMMGALLRLELHGFPHPVAELAATGRRVSCRFLSRNLRLTEVVHGEVSALLSACLRISSGLYGFVPLYMLLQVLRNMISLQPAKKSVLLKIILYEISAEEAIDI